MHTESFELRRPHQTLSGAVVASPHSGRAYGDAFLRASALDAHTLRSSEDAHVDELVAAAPGLGVPLLLANTPRAYVDLNRHHDELDPALIDGAPRGSHNPRITSGLGVIPRVVANGRAIYRGKMSLAEAHRRLVRHWHPYHQALGELLSSQLAQFPRTILVDCHSMPHEAIESHGRQMGKIPEVVLGDRFGASCGADVVSAIELVFRRHGFTVARNTPFAGAFISQEYGRPSQNRHVVQVELDRSLYMDEATLMPHAGFDRVRQAMTEVIAEVASLARPSIPLAAE
ncbi:MAG: N-formylglutamate amidohydrolase [Pseudomonadota bacterium]